MFIATSFTYYTKAAKCSMNVKLNTYVGNSLLQLDTLAYTNAMGQPYSVTKLKYYVGNIQLQMKDGTKFISSDYYLIDEDESASKNIGVKNIPEGEYTSIS